MYCFHCGRDGAYERTACPSPRKEGIVESNAVHRWVWVHRVRVDLVPCDVRPVHVCLTAFRSSRTGGYCSKCFKEHTSATAMPPPPPMVRSESVRGPCATSGCPFMGYEIDSPHAVAAMVPLALEHCVACGQIQSKCWVLQQVLLRNRGTTCSCCSCCCCRWSTNGKGWEVSLLRCTRVQRVSLHTEPKDLWQTWLQYPLDFC
jgi:hypothetical protein